MLNIYTYPYKSDFLTLLIKKASAFALMSCSTNVYKQELNFCHSTETKTSTQYVLIKILCELKNKTWAGKPSKLIHQGNFQIQSDSLRITLQKKNFNSQIVNLLFPKHCVCITNMRRPSIKCDKYSISWWCISMLK